VASASAAGVFGKGTGSSSIGVIGESNTGSAVGVLGVSSSPTGFGLYGRGLSGARALYAEGNVGQNLDSGGVAKAMIEVDAGGSILRCYNGINNTSSGGCGITVTQPLGFAVAFTELILGFRFPTAFFRLRLSILVKALPVPTRVAQTTEYSAARRWRSLLSSQMTQQIHQRIPLCSSCTEVS
jgi:hypothetical protein